jgi:hypothetical protein
LEAILHNKLIIPYLELIAEVFWRKKCIGFL